MKAVITSKAPCKLKRGQLRRVPQAEHMWMVGFHVCCPKCGFTTFVYNKVNDMQMSIIDNNISFSKPFECLFCDANIYIEEGEFIIEEGRDVRMA